MLASSENTGSTDLRDTEVQQPNTAATLSFSISSRAFSAKSGQLDAGSTTTASSILPSKPPNKNNTTNRNNNETNNKDTEFAIVPDSECRIPTLIVSSAAPAG